MIVATRFLAAINLAGAAISLALLAATFFAEGVIVREARQFALNKTRSYLDPAIPKAEKLLENPLLSKTLPPSVRGKLKGELADYRESPDKWLLEIAEGTQNRARDFEFPEVTNPVARTTLDFMAERLAQARGHFEDSFSNLIRDLRIFAITNGCAFLVAGWLCLVAKTKQSRYWLGAWSASLLVATLLASYLYAGQSWVWSILANSYYGWTYAGTHLVITFWLIKEILPELVTHAPRQPSGDK